MHDGHTEAVYLAQVPELPRLSRPPLAGLAVRRSVGLSGTRLSAVLEDEVIGYIEVEVRAEAERLARHADWADVGNLHVSEHYRRRRVATWLVGQAADWLALAQVGRVLDYAYLDGSDAPGNDDADHRAFLASLPFAELTSTRRGWTKPTP